jgi:hypothetical protein
LTVPAVNVPALCLNSTEVTAEVIADALTVAVKAV